ncbi:MAG: hypothetical protein ABW166_19140 [Sedimenticola sp.]
MSEWTEYANEAKLAFDLFRQSIGLYKTAKDLLPDSAEKEAASKAMDEAERNFRIAEAKLAESLDFPLCRKEWPPTVLTATLIGKNKEKYICKDCGTEYMRHGKRIGKIILEELPQNPQPAQNE